MSALVTVPFHGDELLAAQDERGVWVPLKRMCEALGVDNAGQQTKLARRPWAVVEMISTTGPDGKTYEMLSLHLDCIPMWLATIEPSRVDESVRAKLVVYQRECKNVLAAHFTGGQPKVDATAAMATIQQIVSGIAAALDRVMERTERNAAAMELRLIDLIDQRFAAFSESSGTIGRRGASRIRGRLRDYADLFTGAERKSTYWKSCHKRADNDLRKALSFSVRAWGLMPSAKDVEAHARLDDMVRVARDVAHQRQALQARQMGIKFGEAE